MAIVCERARRSAVSGLFHARKPAHTSATKTPGEVAMAETIEGFVGRSLDDAKISPLHVRAIALIAAGYFFDVIDLIVLGSLIPDMVQSNFATGAQAAAVGSPTVLGMFIGAAVWPIARVFAVAFRDTCGGPVVCIVFGIGALIVWLFRFPPPESPRYLSARGKGQEALDILKRLGIAGPTEPLATDAASDTK